MALDPRPEQCILGLGLKAQGYIDRCRDENMAESRGQAWAWRPLSIHMNRLPPMDRQGAFPVQRRPPENSNRGQLLRIRNIIDQVKGNIGEGRTGT